MRYMIGLFIVVLLYGCAAAPTASDPAPQPQPPISLSTLDVAPLLVQPGDWPADVEVAAVSRGVPDLFADAPTPQQAAYLPVNPHSVVPGGVTLLLYDAASDQNRAYEYILSSMASDTRPVGNIGERALLGRVTGAMNGAEMLSHKDYIQASLLFQRCRAVVYVRLRDEDRSEDEVKAYGRRLDQRLQAAVC